jgi:autotransporter-associated beta strand protein
MDKLGRLQLNAGGSVGNLVDDGSLIFASSGTLTFGALISGPGNVIQDGTGTTILSGRNTYTGGTVIDLVRCWWITRRRSASVRSPSTEGFLGQTSANQCKG